jgi:hypothetical protein
MNVRATNWKVISPSPLKTLELRLLSSQPLLYNSTISSSYEN